MAESPPTWLILNGAKPEPPGLRDAVAARREAGHPLRVLPTWEAGDARRLARDAARLGVPAVLAAGGDGTLHEVARGLLEGSDGAPPPELGLLPLGTGNDLARSCGVPLGDLPAALGRALEARARPLDLARADREPFFNMATYGPGCQVTAETPPALKDLLGQTAYLLSGLASLGSLEPVELRVRAGDERWQGPALSVAVGNGRSAGGGHVLCPWAEVDDGALDISVIRATEDEGLLEVLARLATGGVEGCEDLVWHARAPELEVEIEGRGARPRWNLDGEPTQLAATTEFRAEAGALRLRH